MAYVDKLMYISLIEMIVKQALLGMDSPEITEFFKSTQLAARYSA